MSELRNFFTINQDGNYLASICRMGKTYKIRGADRLRKAVVNGYDVVVDTSFQEGDIVVYFPPECAISETFLSHNNLYRYSHYMKNENKADVDYLLDKARRAKDGGNDEEYEILHNEAISLCGFFPPTGRVRALKIKNQVSVGFVVSFDVFWETYFGSENPLSNDEKESLVGMFFDTLTIDGNEEKVCWKYLTQKEINIMENERRHREKMSVSIEERVRKRIEMAFRKAKGILIPGEFQFHYPTKMLNTTINELNPRDIVTVTVKIHGTSVVIANVLCNKKLSWWQKFLGKSDKEYRNVFSSRWSIKNEDLNPDAVDGGYYKGESVYVAANNLLKPYVKEGMTIYAEIVGYLPGSDTMIQPYHDYGCKIGEWKVMPYRITTDMVKGEVGTKNEWDVKVVRAWTLSLINNHPDIADKIMPIEILYNGQLGKMYPDIDENSPTWHEELLEHIKNDKERLLMEEDEPLCTMFHEEVERLTSEIKSKPRDKKLKERLKAIKEMIAPREGIVIRKDGDLTPEAWKIKSLRHYLLATKLHDAGFEDMEEQQESC